MTGKNNYTGRIDVMCLLNMNKWEDRKLLDEMGGKVLLEERH
jgi:hypothetical protein